MKKEKLFSVTLTLYSALRKQILGNCSFVIWVLMSTISLINLLLPVSGSRDVRQGRQLAV